MMQLVEGRRGTFGITSGPDTPLKRKSGVVMKELQKQLLALSADAYSEHQSRGDRFALRVADVTAGLALKVKQLVAEAEQPSEPISQISPQQQ